MLRTKLLKPYIILYHILLYLKRPSEVSFVNQTGCSLEVYEKKL